MRRISWFFLLAIFALFWPQTDSVSAHAPQTPPPFGLPSQLTPGSLTRFEHLTLDNGLSPNADRSIFQDRRGEMWFGAQAGFNLNPAARQTHAISPQMVGAGMRRYLSYTQFPNPVTSPFGQTIGVGIVAALILAGIVMAGFQWRLRAIKDNAQRLEVLVAQRTAELSESKRQMENEVEQRKRAEAELAKRAERELRKSEARFQAVFENAAVGISLISLDGKILANNPVTEKIIGYTQAELQQMDPLELMFEEDRSVDTELYQELIAGKRNSYVSELRYYRKDGSIYWVRVNYSLVPDLEGKPDYLIALVENIDEEKRAAEKLGTQEAEYRRTLEERIAERTEELNQANHLLQQKAAQDASNNERTRLARDLHDAVTQTLFSASLIAEVLPTIVETNPAEGRKRLEELRQLTRGALAEMRMLLVELRPNALTEIPLPNLIRQLCESVIGRDRLPIQLDLAGQRKLPPAVQIGLYRIAQEALNNVVKHAKATQAVVTLSLDEQARLEIADNGFGFDQSEVAPDHFGLQIMRERAEAMGAQLSIHSAPNAGTQISVTWQAKDTQP